MSFTPGIVAFDPAAFQAAYPSFASVSGAALTSNFGLATLYLNNSYCSVVQDAPTRAQLLNLATAHITALLNGVNGQPPSGVVGRISNATQGSVSVQMEYKTNSEAAAFWQQTQWGAAFWAATAVYRTMRYVRPSYCGDASWEAWPQ
jgi:Protein of unknown function (DUF4054)